MELKARRARRESLGFVCGRRDLPTQPFLVRHGLMSMRLDQFAHFIARSGNPSHCALIRQVDHDTNSSVQEAITSLRYLGYKCIHISTCDVPDSRHHEQQGIVSPPVNFCRNHFTDESGLLDAERLVKFIAQSAQRWRDECSSGIVIFLENGDLASYERNVAKLSELEHELEAFVEQERASVVCIWNATSASPAMSLHCTNMHHSVFREGLTIEKKPHSRLNVVDVTKTGFENATTLKLALRASGEFIWDWDLANDTVRCDAGLTKLLGLAETTSEYFSDSWLVHVSPDHLPHVQVEMQRHLRGETHQFCIEYPTCTAEGTQRWILNRGKVVAHDSSGSPVRFLGTCADITQCKKYESKLVLDRNDLQAEIERRNKELIRANRSLRKEIEERKRITCALRKNNERLRLATQATRDGLYDWDIVANDFWCSEAYKTLLGQVPRLSDGAWLERVHKMDRNAVDRDTKQALSGRQLTYVLEYRCELANGGWGQLLDHGVIVRDATGHAIRVVGAVTDVTKLKLAEDTAKLSERLASIGTLASGFAHEINNPIGTILLAAENGLRSGDCRNDAMVRKSLERIVEDARRCGRITKDLMTFARFEPFEKRHEDLASVIGKAVQLTERYARQKTGVIKFSVDSQIPPLLMKPLEIQQAIVQLIRHSLDSTARGATVTVEAKSENEFVRIDLTVDGPEVSSSHPFQVPDPFCTTNQNFDHPSSGLGVVYDIVQAHGGTIQIAFNSNGGAAVQILLPVNPLPRATREEHQNE